jgi:hypothetical protein
VYEAVHHPFFLLSQHTLLTLRVLSLTLIGNLPPSNAKTYLLDIRPAKMDAPSKQNNFYKSIISSVCSSQLLEIFAT